MKAYKDTILPQQSSPVLPLVKSAVARFAERGYSSFDLRGRGPGGHIHVLLALVI